MATDGTSGAWVVFGVGDGGDAAEEVCLTVPDVGAIVAELEAAMATVREGQRAMWLEWKPALLVRRHRGREAGAASRERGEDMPGLDADDMVEVIAVALEMDRTMGMRYLDVMRPSDENEGDRDRGHNDQAGSDGARTDVARTGGRGNNIRLPWRFVG